MRRTANHQRIFSHMPGGGEKMSTQRTGFLIVLLAFGIAAIGTTSAHSQAKGQTWTVLGGAGAENNGLAALRFLPQEITINAGDTVKWKWGGGDAHTVFFPAGGPPPKQVRLIGRELVFDPAVVFPTGRTVDGTAPVSAGGVFPPDPSGQGPPPPSLTFTKPGTYKYQCLFHPKMEGTVVVQPAGSPHPNTQAQVDAQARREAEPALAAARKVFQGLSAEKMTGPGRKATHILTLRAAEDELADVLRFVPARLNIRVGDRVTWNMANNIDLHTVTFLGKTNKMVDIVVVKPQKAGPPIFAVNPLALKRTPEAAFNGKGNRNSGILGTQAYAEFAGYGSLVKLAPSYSLTFTQPGTYPYHCTIHPFAGMRGTIVVAR